MNPEQTLARINKATITYYNGPPLLTSYLYLDYAEPGRKIGGTGQGFGGRGLGGEYAFKWINGIMECLGVENWDDVTGKYVWVDHTHSNVERIVSVDTGKVFDPSGWEKQ